MLRLCWIIVFLFIVPSLQAETIYKWVDKNGVVNFTDDLEKVPVPYRDQVQRIESKEEKKDVQKGGLPSLSSPSVERREVDIYGRDEAWWRESASLEGTIEGGYRESGECEKEIFRENGRDGSKRIGESSSVSNRGRKI